MSSNNFKYIKIDDYESESLDRLKNAKRMTQETISIANSISQELSDQREKIIRMTNSGNKINDDLKKSNSILNRIISKAKSNKIISILIITICIVVIGGIIVLIFL